MADKINGEIEDLTEPEESEEAENTDKKKKRRKKTKTLKDSASPEEDTKKPKKSKKAGKKKDGILKVVLVIILTILIAGFVFEELYYNSLGTREMLIDAVVRLDPEYGSREKNLDEREAAISTLESQLELRERTITSREKQNDSRTTDLQKREVEFQNMVSSWSAPLYKREMTEQELLDMQSLSRAYSLMTPEAAAAILIELGQIEDVAAILYHMTNRNASAILAVMDPGYAAEITNILLYN